MRNEVKSRVLLTLSVAIVLSMSVLFASEGPTAFLVQSSSAQSLPSSGTPVATPTPESDPDAGLRAACAEAVEELRAARQLIKSQDGLIERQNELLTMEQRIQTGLKDLRTLDAEEKQHLRNAVAAANRETAAVRAENAVLKKQRMTFWKKAKWFVIGGAAGGAVCLVLCRR